MRMSAFALVRCMVVSALAHERSAVRRLQVDRIEAEVMQLVPGVRYVDLETDRGRFSSYARTALVKEVEEVRAETFAPPPPVQAPNGAAS